MKTHYLLFFVLLSSPIIGQDVAFRQKNFLVEKGVAVQGYDVVSYFSSKAQKGKAEFSYNYAGINYRFANTANLEAFKKEPAKYEPQYGGWCAYAMGAKGEKVEINPETFKILDGKLYLFYNRFFNNTLTDWNKDQTNLKKQADANWQKIVR
jgi:YHS domain-containing protein